MLFPFTDLSKGKRRPSLVLSSQLVNATADLVCVQITSKKFNDSLYLELSPSTISPPLLLKSGIRLHKLFTVQQSLVSKKIGEMNPETLTEVLQLIQEKVFAV